MKKYNNIMELRNAAVEVWTGLQISWPMYNKAEPLSLGDIPEKFEHKYAWNNGTIAFVDEGRVFVIPVMWNVHHLLLDEGFRIESFYVPFSSGNFPLQYKAKWEALRAEQKQSQQEQLLEDCAEYCKKNGIGEISDELLEQAMQIPAIGMKTHHPIDGTKIYTPIGGCFFDSVFANYMGTYDTNNGVCIFLCGDGKTYITKSRNAVNALEAAGYRRKKQIVPLSDGEVLVDPALKMRWSAM